MTNLLLDEWINVRRQDGSVDRIAPFELSPQQANPPVTFRIGREDLEMATRECLIGIFQTFLAPSDPGDWVKRFHDTPPAPEELKSVFEAVSDPFQVTNSDHPFMQETGKSMEEQDNLPIVDLAMWGVSSRDVRINRNHFVDENQVQGVCSSCGAMVLYMIQTQTPTIMYRYRGAPRGRQTGFVSTFLNGSTLWDNVTFNVLPESEFKPSPTSKPSPDKLFPWLAPEKYFDDTKVYSAGGGVKSRGEDIKVVHPYQVYWTTPWRVSLNHEDRETNCDLCGSPTSRPVTSYSKQSMGIDYSGRWYHPLSPYQKEPNAEEIAYYSIPETGLSYRDIGVFEFGIDPKTSSDQPHVPARVIQSVSENYFSDYHDVLSEARLEVSGYRIYSRNKPAHWEHAEFEFHNINTDERDQLRSHVGQVIRGLKAMVKLTRQRLEWGLFGQYESGEFDKPEKDDINIGLYRDLQEQFWNRMENTMRTAINRFVKVVRQESDESVETVKLDLVVEAREELVNLFDQLSKSYNIDHKRAWYEARHQVEQFLKPDSNTVTDHVELHGLNITDYEGKEVRV